MATPQTLLTGRALVESPRWHDGRLWFSVWQQTGQVVMAEAPAPGAGWPSR